jgi:hypothetical protein
MVRVLAAGRPARAGSRALQLRLATGPCCVGPKLASRDARFAAAALRPGGIVIDADALPVDAEVFAVALARSIEVGAARRLDWGTTLAAAPG